MAVNFALTKRFEVDPEVDTMRRSWAGWDPARTDAELWEANRGRWLLGERALIRERYATLSYGGIVRVVAEIDGYEELADPPRHRMKKALMGAVLTPGDPVRDALVGRPVPRSRNPVSYLDTSDVDGLRRAGFC